MRKRHKNVETNLNTITIVIEEACLTESEIGKMSNVPTLSIKIMSILANNLWVEIKNSGLICSVRKSKDFPRTCIFIRIEGKVFNLVKMIKFK